eukprot:7208842-Prymnesium_polylepis.2
MIGVAPHVARLVNKEHDCGEIRRSGQRERLVVQHPGVALQPDDVHSHAESAATQLLSGWSSLTLGVAKAIERSQKRRVGQNCLPYHHQRLRRAALAMLLAPS